MKIGKAFVARTDSFSTRAGAAPAVGFAGAFAVAFLATAFACGTDSAKPAAPPASADASVDCPPCTTDDDCHGGVCAQIGGDSFCTPTCPNGDECSTDRVCTAVSTIEGQQANGCVTRIDSCGDGTPPPAVVTPPSPNAVCGTLVGPDVAAQCHSCGAQPCQANGCFGGWWCNTASNKCQTPPATCTSGDGGAYQGDAGPVTGQVGPSGGSVSRLYFAVVGDTRPPAINDTAAYPSTIIHAIYNDLEVSSPRPSFVVSTGDYVFTSPQGSGAAQQLDLYLAARNQFSGVVFPAMGNHECTGATASNCGAGNADGVTANYTSFLQKLLQPIGQTSPNYVIDINGEGGSWTGKLVFIAGNAWSSGDATWLDGALSKPTTYTFIIRHEPKAASEAPGCAASEKVMALHPYTLAIVGHTHTYGRTGPRQVTIGNGGAPLVSGTNYGYGLISQRPDGAIQVDMIDYATGQPDLAFRFAVHPDGSAAP